LLLEKNGVVLMKRAYHLLLAIALLAAPFPAFAKNILVLGDSLSASFGIPQQSGWVNLLQQLLQQQHPSYKVINASISGETTSGGVTRINGLLQQHKPKIVIIELGANDGLRGLPLKEMKKNLDQIIRQCKQANATVVLVGLRLPPNYGHVYTHAFEQTYTELASRHRITLIPFLFAGLEDSPRHFQNDNLHPTAAAQEILLNNIWQKLSPLLR
jgi:acyl-CoA thioesterase I